MNEAHPNGLDSGHGAGKVSSDAALPQGSQTRRQVPKSCAHGWPRLLSYAEAGAYLGVSADLVGEYVRAGLLAVVRLPRPDTPRDRRRAFGDHVRRRLVDVHDLDELVDRLKGRDA